MGGVEENLKQMKAGNTVVSTMLSMWKLYT